jgi:RNA polymerase sigma factor (sigma-70 family)
MRVGVRGVMGANAPPPARQIAAALLEESRRTRLFSYARSRFGIAADDAEDLLQDTASELLRYRDYVRRPEGFVFSVFRSRCIRYATSRRQRREIFVTGGNAEAPSAPPEWLDRRIALREALTELSASCQRLLCVYYVEGHSLREAAKLVSLQYSSVGKTLSRCVKKLRERLG